MKKEILQGSSKTMGIEDLSVREFLDQTASSAPVPGGGSTAAVTAGSAGGAFLWFWEGKELPAVAALEKRGA